MDGTIKGPGGPGPPNFAAPSVKIIGFKGNLVVVTNKSPIRPLQNKFGPPKINVQVPSMRIRTGTESGINIAGCTNFF